MYSHEISQIMEKYQSNIPSSIYMGICKNSPQITHIFYDAFADCFNMWDEEGNRWRFKVLMENA